MKTELRNVFRPERWEKAQEYEKSYWKSRITDPVGIIDDFYSGFILGQLIESKKLNEKSYSRIIDIGVGGLGIGLLWLFDAKEKVGIDPLDVHKPETSNVFMQGVVEGAQKGNIYKKSKAENLPFNDSYFDLVICNNVLDHTHNPYEILKEIRRVLQQGGLFLFAVDTFSVSGLVSRKIGKRINPNAGSYPGHPYDWTEGAMTKILSAAGFSIEFHNPRPLKGRLLGRRRRSTWICQRC